jgi:MATE family multidrug resistance protein
MSHALPIKGKARQDCDPDNLHLSSSFHASSPFAQEIIARDIATCAGRRYHGENGERCYQDDEETLSDTESEYPLKRQTTNEHAPTLLGHGRPTGVAFGSSRPAIAVDTVLPESEVLTERELQDAFNAERSLLRDNHILPPKHPRKENEPFLRRLYRGVFSTKVPASRNEPHLPAVSRVSTKEVDENSPLLGAAKVVATDGYDSIPPSPGEEQARWESAVAANVLKTTWQREAKTLAQYATPLIVTFLLHYSVTVTSVFTVGRIGTLELGAVSCMLLPSLTPRPFGSFSRARG